NVKNKTIDKIKKKSRSFHHPTSTSTSTNTGGGGGGGEFGKSEDSLMSNNSNDDSSTNNNDEDNNKRRSSRGRSLGLKMSRKKNTTSGNNGYNESSSSGNKKNNKNNGGGRSSGGGGRSTRRRARSNSQSHNDDNDKKVRDRSRSLVRDARSFIESIEGNNTGSSSSSNNKKKKKGGGATTTSSRQSRSPNRSRTTTIMTDNTESSGVMTDGEEEEVLDSSLQSVSSRSSTIVTGSSNITNITNNTNNTNNTTNNAGGGSTHHTHHHNYTPPRSGIFLRNKFKEQQALQELQEDLIQRRTSSGGSSSSNFCCNNNNDLDQSSSERTLQLLSSLQITNEQNESTIQNLQEQLTDLTNERNAFRNNSERMMEVMTKQKSHLEKELKKERKGFADVSHSHKKEIEEWKKKTIKAERKIRDGGLEENNRLKAMQEQEKEGMRMLREVRGVREKENENDDDDNNNNDDDDGGSSRAVADSATIKALNNGQLGKEASLLASTLGINLASPTNQQNLCTALLKLSELESNYNNQVQQLQSDNATIQNQVMEWKEKHQMVNKHHEELLEEREDETVMVTALENKLEGCRIVIESMKIQQEQQEDVHDGHEVTNDTTATTATATAASSSVNDELVERIGDLAEENGQLLLKVQQLENKLQSSGSSSIETSVTKLTQDLEQIHTRYDEAEATIETLRVENRNLRISFDNQHDVKETSRQMKSLVKSLRSSLTKDGYDDDGGYDSMENDNEDDDSNINISRSKPITEMEHKEALATISEMQTENDALHVSMEEAMSLASDMNDRMARIVKTHETTVQGYKTEVSTLKEELSAAHLAKEGLSTKIETLMKENKTLTVELEEANTLVVCSVRDEIKQEQLSKEYEKTRQKMINWHKEKRDLSTSMETLKTENERLHTSMKEMTTLVATAEGCVDKLNEENASLKDTQEYYQQQLQEMTAVEKEANQYLREEIKSVSMEREEAYDTCKVLQEEINVLRLEVKESEGRVEQLVLQQQSENDGSKNNNAAEDIQVKLTELTKSNNLLTKELEQKNEALQAVQSALENLKTEQTTIKDTISELRQENAKLRDIDTTSNGSTSTPPLHPPPPKSILKAPTMTRRPSPSDGSSDNSNSEQQQHQQQQQQQRILLKLESRIKKVEKENKGLREANSTLSAKLFDEMEKTDALRVANEGLAARICKLVAFIQSNPNGSGEGGGGGGTAGAATPSSSSSGNNNGSSSSSKKGGGSSSSKRSKSRERGKSRERTKNNSSKFVDV
ncbi:hypothetical protein ACHAXR_009180, partial [Thalassiosira sp. AJA248-18]